MKKIIIVGSGHGGLVAGAKLAKKGYDVTIFEKKERRDLGYDWEDRFSFDILSRIIEKDIPDEIWRYRGDCAFVSPAQRTSVEIRYTDETRQKIMERKPLIKLLIEYAENNGVKFRFATEVKAPIVTNNRVTGIITQDGNYDGDLIIDAAGVFSPIRTQLPSSCNVEEEIKRGDVFYAYRAYFDKLDCFPKDNLPFEVYLYHEGEQGLSWLCTNENDVDILIGRIDPLTQEQKDKQLAIFRQKKPWVGDKLLRGGNYAVIPVRSPLAQIVCDGYAAVGDSAFMTTPMNGMGIDLSLLAGEMLAKCIMADADGAFTTETLWGYNKEFHTTLGGTTAKNEGLKNALLNMPSEGVDFLFDNRVIQSSDLAGAGRNTDIKSLLGKFYRGMRKPKYFFAIIRGLIKGAKKCAAYKRIPACYDIKKVTSWKNKITKATLKIER